MRVIYGLVSIFIFFSCKNKIEYHQNLDLVWETKDVDWNASSLILDDNFIYGHTMNDSIFKLNFSNGEIDWKRYSRGSYSNLTPVIFNNKIFVGGADKLKAFDKKGNLLWSKSTNTKTIGLTFKDSIVFNTRTNEGLFANHILNGKELWSIKPNYQMLSMSNPSIIDSLLIIGDFDYKKNIGNHLTCINIDKQMILWQIENKGYINSPAIIESKSVIFNSDSAYQKGYTYKADLLNGDILWKTKTSPVIHYESKKYKNKIFVPSYENGIICLNNDTGKILWRLDKRYYPNTKLLIHNNILYFCTIKREFIGVNDKGEIVFQSNLEYGIGNPFIYNDKIYVNDGNGKLFVIKNTVANSA